MLPLDDQLLERVRRSLTRMGRTTATASRDQTVDALQAWAGMENLEERCHSREQMDPLVMRLLEERATG
ncbi:MAG: putative peptidoglycan binding domain-containing protein [Candidatus Dormibacteria bacterium]